MTQKMTAMAAALEPLITNVNIDVTNTYAAWLLSGESMATFDRVVHEYFFKTYFNKHQHVIQRRLARIFDQNDEILIGALIGKVENKLPTAFVPGFPDDYHERKARKTMAGLICHSLMDANTVPSKIQVKRNAEGKWETLTYLYLGGDPKKDLLKGLHFKPGVFEQTHNEGWKLRSADKKRGKRLASIPFELSDVASDEIIMHGYELKPDWNRRTDKYGKKLPEDFNTKVERYRGYKDLIMSLRGERFYLELKYSGSGRMFYKTQIEGARPQGKKWETQMIDSAEAYYLSVEQRDALKHLIYCELKHERVTPAEACKKWTDDLLEDALAIDPLKAESEDDYGDMIFTKKAALALQAARDNKPTKYLFGWDFTNSGLIMAGLSFNSEHMLDAGNVHTRDDVVDMHSKFGEAYNLNVSRKEIKRVHMPLLHGSTLKGLVNKVHEITGNTDLTLADVREKNLAAYGPCVDNLIDIADWGVDILHNTQTRFSWTLPDGFRANHKAYFESVPVVITVASANERHAKTGKTTHTIISDMPYATDNAGRPLIGDVKAKVRGLYANITHSLDAYVLRNVVDALLDEGQPVLLKHDDYMVHPGSYEIVLKAARKVFNELFESNLYARALEEIAANAVTKPEVPALILGNAENVIDDARAFLMP